MPEGMSTRVWGAFVCRWRRQRMKAHAGDSLNESEHQPAWSDNAARARALAVPCPRRGFE